MAERTVELLSIMSGISAAEGDLRSAQRRLEWCLKDMQDFIHNEEPADG